MILPRKICRSPLPSLSLVGLAIFLSASVLPAPCRASEKSTGRFPLIFEGLSEPEMREAREVYLVTRDRFMQLTGRKVGALPVRVQIVEHLSSVGQASRTVRQVMGTTVQHGRECQVYISVFRRGSLGRVLAHEFTHTFLREAYGNTSNQALSEGLAEYLSSLSYSAEVNHDLRAASAAYVSAPKLQPYVEGYNFCLHYADSPHFISFFDRQVYLPDFGFDCLMSTWKQHREVCRR